MSGYGPFLHSIAAGLIVLTFAGKNGSAQDTLSTAQDTLRITHPDSLSKKIFELEQSLEEIKETLSDQKQNDEFEALLKEAERLSHQEEEHKVDVSKKYFSGVRQQQGLNPNISFGMDFFGGVSTSKENSISDPSDISYGNNGFFLRASLSTIMTFRPAATLKSD